MAFSKPFEHTHNKQGKKKNTEIGIGFKLNFVALSHIRRYLIFDRFDSVAASLSPAFDKHFRNY